MARLQEKTLPKLNRLYALEDLRKKPTKDTEVSGA